MSFANDVRSETSDLTLLGEIFWAKQLYWALVKHVVNTCGRRLVLYDDEDVEDKIRPTLQRTRNKL